jgi:hypothetical protein
MSTPNTLNWIRVGLLALPVYGLLTFWSTLDPQPDQVKEPEEWARFVSSTSYLVDHIFGAIGARFSRSWASSPSGPTLHVVVAPGAWGWWLWS